MNRGELERLLWEEIDGELAAEQRSRLERALAADPEARVLAASVRSINDGLSKLEDASPPAVLHPRVTAALDASEDHGPARLPHRRAASGGRRGAYLALAAGLFVAAMAVLFTSRSVVVDPTVSKELLVGTAGARGGERWLDLDLGGDRGRLRLRRTSGVLTGTLEGDPAGMEVQLTRTGLRLLPDARNEGLEGEEDHLKWTPGEVVGTFRVGLGEPLGGGLAVRVVADGRAVFERVIEVEEIPEVAGS